MKACPKCGVEPKTLADLCDHFECFQNAPSSVRSTSLLADPVTEPFNARHCWKCGHQVDPQREAKQFRSSVTLCQCCTIDGFACTANASLEPLARKDRG